jgi:hypothetical protein
VCYGAGVVRVLRRAEYSLSLRVRRDGALALSSFSLAAPRSTGGVRAEAELFLCSVSLHIDARTSQS